MRQFVRGLISCVVLFAAILAGPSLAQPPAPDAKADGVALTPEQAKALAEEEKRLDGIQASLKPQHGIIALPDAKASLNLGDKYYFLGPADSRKVLVDAWGNPPEQADGVLGMIFAEGATVKDNLYGVVVSFEDSGFVTDEEVGKNDYDKLLKEMQESADEASKERAKKGFGTLRIIGWAQPPSYDKPSNNLIWARELEFDGSPNHTLNYDVRHLGRKGVLSMNFVSSMAKLAELRPVATELARTAEFDTGSRYADHQNGDKMAGYGLVGLVGAGVGLAVAKKVGLIGVALLLVKKFAVVILAFFGGIAAWFRKLFGLKPKAPNTRQPMPALDLDAPTEPAALEAPEAEAGEPSKPEDTAAG